MRINFDREGKWWDAKAAKEERDLADEAVNRALRWREIERNLENIDSILDVGAGTGIFSIPLAQRGFSVTHLDFSSEMIKIARQKASSVPNISFVQGNAANLSQFRDQSFDLVLNLDGAISFSGSEAERVLSESCRVAKKKLIVTVSHRAWMVACLVTVSLLREKRLLPAVSEMIKTGQWHQEQYPDNALLSEGVTQDYLGALKAFLPDELRKIIGESGMRILRLGGLGSLANLCGGEALKPVLGDEALFQEFLDLCEDFDKETLPEGPGTRERAGLIAVAERMGV